MDTSGKVEVDRFCSLSTLSSSLFLNRAPQREPLGFRHASSPGKGRGHGEGAAWWGAHQMREVDRQPPELGRRFPGLASNFHPGPLLVKGDDPGHVEAAKALGVRGVVR